MSDTRDLPVPQDIAWEALNNTELLQLCIPGCESITLKEDGGYAIVINAAVGPIRAKFKGDMRMLDVVAPTSYKLEFSVQGGGVGHGRGDAAVALSAAGPNVTKLEYVATANVGGKLAQIGARLIDMTAQKMAAEFFDRFQTELTKQYAPEATVATPAKSASTGLWARLTAWLGQLFGAKSQG